MEGGGYSVFESGVRRNKVCAYWAELCVAGGWPSSSSSLKWSSGSLTLIVGLCRVGGPVPDLVNALDLSKSSVRALIPLWVPRMSGGKLEVRSPLGCIGGLCRGGNRVRYGCEFGTVHHKGMLGYVTCTVASLTRSHLLYPSKISWTSGKGLKPSYNLVQI